MLRAPLAYHSHFARLVPRAATPSVRVLHYVATQSVARTARYGEQDVMSSRGNKTLTGGRAQPHRQHDKFVLMNKQRHELEVFRDFVSSANLHLGEETAANAEPPQPDILCTIDDEIQYFELAAVMWENPDKSGETLAKGLHLSEEASRRKSGLLAEGRVAEAGHPNVGPTSISAAPFVEAGSSKEMFAVVRNQRAENIPSSLL